MRNFFTLALIAFLCQPAANGTPRPLSPEGAEFAQFRSNLYAIAADGSRILVDGTLTDYDTDYSNDIDGKDARKMFNSSENFGMLRGSIVLIIERRHSIVENDSVFFKMWNMRAITYQLELIASNLNKPGRVGVLEDNYLKTATPIDLNGTSNINFSVTADPASKATDRFRIIFSTINPTLPFTFTSVRAFQQNNLVSLDWKTTNENNVNQYNIERSADGDLFNKIADVKAGTQSDGSYSWTDKSSPDGYNYYRIQSAGSEGEITYSPVLKVYKEKYAEGVKVFPNPITDNTIHLKIENQPAGLYIVRLINNFGQPVMVKQVKHPGGSSTTVINPVQNISKGLYQLEITKPGGSKTNIQLMY
jgi:hypothetical protein